MAVEISHGISTNGEIPSFQQMGTPTKNADVGYVARFLIALMDYDHAHHPRDVKDRSQFYPVELINSAVQILDACHHL